MNMLYSEVSPRVCLCEVHLVRDASASVCAQRDFGLNVHGIQADGTNPAVNAVYRVLAICMLAIGLYEIKLPELDERVKEYYSKVCVLHARMRG